MKYKLFGIYVLIVFILLLLFSKNKTTYAIHTIFILKENILFLEEWIKYHIHIGFDKFYLYDNSGSKYQNIHNGDIIKMNKTNKYDINYDKYIDNEQTEKKFKDILNKYKNHIIYIKWQPKNENGEIEFGQPESINHYIKKYKKYNEWTAFIDMDEFIYMKNHDSIQDFINEKKNYNKIIMNMKNFDDRFLHVNKSIFDIDNSIKHQDIFIRWGNKNICKNSDLINTKIIHDIQVNNEKQYNSKNIDEIRFNHYNVNKKKLEWMKEYFKKNNFEIEKDNSMKKFKNIVN
jgi:hypothetical protein